MALRNPFDFGNSYAKKPSRNFFSGQSQDPAASNTRRFLEQVSFQPPAQHEPPEVRDQGMEWGNWMQEMRDAYTREGPSQSAYREHLGAIPQYQNPSKWGKFGAALVGAAEGLRSGGAAGWNAAQEAAQTPYRRELEQWGMKEQALGRQAAIEEKQSGNRIQFMNQVRSMAKDEQQARQWMAEYDHKRWLEENDEAHREAERGRWDRQDLETYTGADGQLYERMPGEAGPGRRVNSTLEGAKFDETKRSNRTGEAISWTNARTGQQNAKTAEGQLTLGQDREFRIGSQPMDPRAQSSARASALTRAASSNPLWRDFVDQDTGGIKPPEVESQADPEWQEFQRFMEKVKVEEQGIFSRPRYNQVIEY